MVSSTEDVFLDARLTPTLSPNPVQYDKLTVEFPSEEVAPLTLEVYDSQGRLVRHQKELVGIGVQKLWIDVASLSPGNYFLQIQQGKMRGVGKFLIL